MTNPADRDWESFLALARPKVDWSTVGQVLCLDPGETTGWARFDKGLLEEAGQWTTTRPEHLAQEIKALWDRRALWAQPAGSTFLTIVYETYRIRGNKAKEHVGSEVVTIQHIGAIKVVADELPAKLYGQSAGMAKGFATDAKLRRWRLFQTNKRHANDAIRHGCYWHLFVAGRQ